ncbi:hypothetical protein H2200_010590 [Cladophialophora chaetospira]|uniref:Uncharacterized protein n=1 Tax=Cladophialophora chaetospira TaxID=386627 RepID=A0AA38X1V4_9EURO|nr:hypothetical protein H2200_010590 [Cladophialophora chaetospira]
MATTSHGFSRNTFTAPQASPRPRSANAPATLVQPRPSSQSSTHSASSFANPPRPGQYGTPPSVPQKRSFTEYQSASQPPERATSSAPPREDVEESSTLAEVMAFARATVAASKLQAPQTSSTSVAKPAATSAPKTAERPIPTNDPNLVAQMAARQREENARAKAARNAPSPVPYIAEEPPLRLGEAPSMTTHPNLIAQMVARKRAEAEMHGHRERWARRQQEHRMSSSPGAQLSHELNAQIPHNSVKQSQPRTISNPLPARSVPTIPLLKPTTPIVFNAQISTPQHPPSGVMTSRDAAPPMFNAQISTPQHPPPGAPDTRTTMPARDAAPQMSNAKPPGVHTPAAETISTPATEDSIRPASGNNNRRSSNDTDSLFGSPFSSPIVEFLEKATDNAGLREALEPNEVMSRSESTTAEPSSQPDKMGDTIISASAEAAAKSQAPSNIPPLFSDKPLTPQSQPHNSNSMPAQTPSTKAIQQSQPLPFYVDQPSQAQTQQTGGRPQLAPRPTPAPRPVPYYPHQAGMPGYYKVELNPNWAGGGSNFVATPASHPPPPGMFHPPQGGMGFQNYTIHPGNPYVVPRPALPPAPGPLQTYGAVAAAEAAARQQKQQAANAGYLTAADLVAGINLKFRHSTQSGFGVPKR